MNKIHRANRNHWWYRWIRGMSWFAFRYWWFVWMLFIVALTCFYFLCCSHKEINCNNPTGITERIKSINKQLYDCCNCEPIIIEPEPIEHDERIDNLRDSLNGCVGPITASLFWESYDDLDLWLIEPSGERIFFNNKISANGGELDIDMNAGEINGIPAIENICYVTEPPHGEYLVVVNFFRNHENLPSLPYKVSVKVGDEEYNFSGIHYNDGESHLVYRFNY